MTARLFYLASFALLIAAAPGCCGMPCGGKNFNCPDCGCLWWNEWFSHPPACCDPCDCNGHFTASHNRWVVGGGHWGQGHGYGGDETFDGQYDGAYEGGTGGYDERTRPTRPTPALAPPEELPPATPSAAYHVNQFGQRVSYRPPVDSPRASRKLGNPRRTRMPYAR